MQREAWKLFRRTLGWHIRQRRWKFLLGFPSLALLHFRAKRI
jgi:hypothetical protein